MKCSKREDDKAKSEGAAGRTRCASAPACRRPAHLRAQNEAKNVVERCSSTARLRFEAKNSVELCSITKSGAAGRRLADHLSEGTAKRLEDKCPLQSAIAAREHRCVAKSTKKRPENPVFCAPSGARTLDPNIKSVVLYQLS